MPPGFSRSPAAVRALPGLSAGLDPVGRKAQSPAWQWPLNLGVLLDYHAPLDKTPLPSSGLFDQQQGWMLGDMDLSMEGMRKPGRIFMGHTRYKDVAFADKKSV